MIFLCVCQLHVADEYDSSWVTCFEEHAEALLGVTSHELGTMMKDDEDEFESVMCRVNFKPVFMKLRVKLERYRVSFCL